MNPGTFQGPGLGQIFNYPFQYGWWHETSTTWIVPYSGVYQIWACGGGGSGASQVTGTGGGAGVGGGAGDGPRSGAGGASCGAGA